MAPAQISAQQQTPTSKKPVSVLFVCLGNICRSPMAEGVFRALTSNLPLQSNTAAPKPTKTSTQPMYPNPPPFSLIDSAGTGAYHALSPPDSRTVAVLRQHGIASYDHSARKVRAQDFRDFDWIFAMDSENLEDLLDLRAKITAKQRLGRTMTNSKASEAAPSLKRREVQENSSVEAVEEREKRLAKVVLFGSFGGSEAEEVIDPYYGGRDGFEVAYEQVERFSRGFLRYLEEEQEQE